MDEPVLELQAFVDDGALRLALHGALLAGSTPRLRTWMEAHVPATATHLVLDLSGLVEVDAVGLGALLAARRRLADDGRVTLLGGSPQVAHALRCSGLLALPVVLPAQPDRRRARQLPQLPALPPLPQQTSRTAPTMAAVTTSTSAALLTKGGIA